MLCGTLVAMIIAMKTMGLKKAEASAANALHSAGMGFLITGAGGSFSAVITAAGVSDAIKNLVSGISGNTGLTDPDRTGRRMSNGLPRKRPLRRVPA